MWATSEYVNPLSANPIKWSNTLKQFVGKFPTNCLSVFDHFVKLALKRLKRLLFITNLFGKCLLNFSKIFWCSSGSILAFLILISYGPRKIAIVQGQSPGWFPKIYPNFWEIRKNYWHASRCIRDSSGIIRASKQLQFT